MVSHFILGFGIPNLPSRVLKGHVPEQISVPCAMSHRLFSKSVPSPWCPFERRIPSPSVQSLFRTLLPRRSSSKGITTERDRNFKGRSETGTETRGTHTVLLHLLKFRFFPLLNNCFFLILFFSTKMLKQFSYIFFYFLNSKVWQIYLLIERLLHYVACKIYFFPGSSFDP